MLEYVAVVNWNVYDEVRIELWPPSPTKKFICICMQIRVSLCIIQMLRQAT